MIHLLPWVTTVVIWAVVIYMWIFYLHSGVLLVMWFASWCNEVWVWPMWGLSWGFVGWIWMQQASISGVVWWAAVCRWSVVWSMWSVTARSMAITPVCRIWVSWATPVMMASIPMLWSRMASIEILKTWAAVSVKMWLRPWMVLPVPVFIAVSGTRSGMVTFVWFGLVMLCWGSQRGNLMWAIHYNVTVFITFKTSKCWGNAWPCGHVPGTGNIYLHHLSSCWP